MKINERYSISNPESKKLFVTCLWAKQLEAFWAYKTWDINLIVNDNRSDYSVCMKVDKILSLMEEYEKDNL